MLSHNCTQDRKWETQWGFRLMPAIGFSIITGSSLGRVAGSGLGRAGQMGILKEECS